MKLFNKQLRKHNRILKRMLMESENREQLLETTIALLKQDIRNNELEIDILRRAYVECRDSKETR